MVLAIIWENRIRDRAIEQGFKQGFKQGFAQGFKQGFKEGRQEALAEHQQLWMAWYRRLQDAEERGVPFTEPHPTLESINTA